MRVHPRRLRALEEAVRALQGVVEEQARHSLGDEPETMGIFDGLW